MEQTEETGEELREVETPQPVDRKKTISFIKHTPQAKVLAWKSNDTKARDIEKLSRSAEKSKI